MMRILLLSILLIVGFTAQSQFMESFEGTTLPDGPTGVWTLGSGNWNVSDNGVGIAHWTVNSVTTAPLVYQGERAAYCNRENIGMGNTSENWLVTPAVAIGPNFMLAFYNRTFIGGDQGTQYQIRVSTTSQTDHSSFVLLNSWTESELSGTFNLYDPKFVSLEQFQGQSIYVAFVRVFTQPTAAIGGDRWLLDNVNIGEGIINTIHGTVNYAGDGNCGTASPLDAVTIAANSGNYTNWSLPNAGQYSVTATSENVTVSPVLPNYFVSVPPSYTFNFTASGTTQTANFCIVPTSAPHYDIDINIIPLFRARPGFDAAYKLIYRNLGNQTASGTINFVFQDQFQDFVSAVPAVASQSLNTLSWNFTDLAVFETREIVIVLNTNSALETPAVNIGDVLNFSAQVSIPQLDEVLENNTAGLNQTVFGSLDPNDKTVSEGATISPDETGNYLHYIIRFQNTGTAPAELVRIADEFSPDLDINTLEITSASHDMRLSRSGNSVDFIFENMNLPPTADDEPGSHGYVAYRIKPLPTIGIGTVIENTANIFFDFNSPIVTNTVTTTVSALGVNDYNPDNGITVYPNPASNQVTINIKSDVVVKSISVVNMFGQIVKKISVNSSSADVTDLAGGSYVVQIVTDKGDVNKKLIKL
ncbi:MAG: T9SS type A sorting domain-containing protein [Flavobacterium sp.]|nr:MAG: T9SS type A sorting domain-containing protein [Flavobacterium sp.]